MAEGTRPGGLTALAVLNFIYSGFCGLTVLGVLAHAAFASSASTADSESGGMSQAIEGAGGENWFYAAGAMDGLFGVLLLLAGIGYLKQRRVMGRRLGSAYAVISILFTSTVVVFVGMQFGMIVALVYPLLTLILLNTTFKDDLVT